MCKLEKAIMSEQQQVELSASTQQKSQLAKAPNQKNIQISTKETIIYLSIVW